LVLWVGNGIIIALIRDKASVITALKSICENNTKMNHNRPDNQVFRQALVLFMILAFLNPPVIDAMSLQEARHLLLRTGFGAPASEVSRFMELTWEEGVAEILNGVRTEPYLDLPEWMDEQVPDMHELRNLSQEEREKKAMEIRRTQRQRGQELKSWWYAEMIATDSPLTERMTLFWHNHFTSSLQKVNIPQIIYAQNALFRRNALGNFRLLTHYVAKDPAMILYLDNQTNRRGKPNENFARELLELFTMGEGHYTEDDIRQAARAFTGWHTDRREASFRFRKRQHDYSTKNFLGERGTFNGGDIIDIIMGQDQTALFIVEKLWREFVSDTPDEKEVRALAVILRRSKYEIKPLLTAILTSPHFRSKKNMGTLVKSPAEFMVGTIRTFSVGLDPKFLKVLVHTGHSLNQDLLDPPNVKGWPGGTVWINSNTLLVRRQFIERVLRTGSPSAGGNSTRHADPKLNAAVERGRTEARKNFDRILKSREKPPMGGNEMMTGAAGEPVMMNAADSAGKKWKSMTASKRGMDMNAWMTDLRKNGFGKEDLFELLVVMNPVGEHYDDDAMNERIEKILIDPVYHLK
jgi:uncharacterized protein (DUF1800 family)